MILLLDRALEEKTSECWAGREKRERRNSDCAEEKAHAVLIQCGLEDLCAPTHDITPMNTAALLQMVMYVFQQMSVCVRPVT